jgi:hypothetical protein
MVVVASRTHIVGGKKPSLAIAIVQFLQVGRASDDVVMGIMFRIRTVIAARTTYRA